MKTFSIYLAIAAAALLVFTSNVQSQQVLGARTPIQQLQQMKAANDQLLEKQTALLLKLDELHKEASQIKFLAKRG